MRLELRNYLVLDTRLGRSCRSFIASTLLVGTVGVFVAFSMLIICLMFFFSIQSSIFRQPTHLQLLEHAIFA